MKTQTFLGMPRLSGELDAQETVDVMVVGVPWDGGSTGARGQALAPDAIRGAGYDVKRGESLYDTITGRDLSALSMVDVGDVPGMWRSDIAGAYGLIHTSISRLCPHAKFLVVLGGDDGINYSVVRAISADQHQPVTLVHFDAHRDTWFSQDDRPCDHGTWVRDLIDDDLVADVHQLGVRCYGPPRDEWDLYRNRIKTYAPDTSNSPHFLLRDIEGPVFIALDIDAVDPAYAPGTGFPEPGGFTSRDIMAMVSLLVEQSNVVGMSVTEVNPKLDVGNATATLANRLVVAAINSYVLRA